MAALSFLAAGCGDDDDGGGADPTAQGDDEATGGGPCTSLDEGSIEDLFDVAVTPGPEDVSGPGFCHFSIDGSPGYGFDVVLVQTGETFDDAVAQMESEPGAAEGSGVQSLDVGDAAAGFAAVGLAYVVVSAGGDLVQVTANLPPDHPLAAADDELLATTGELAALVV